MKLALLKDRRPAFAEAGHDGTSAPIAAIAGAAPRRPPVPDRGASHREPTPIVRLPVAPGREPAARAVAEADLRVKRFHGNAVADDRYTVSLRAASTAPAALLAALADAAGRIEELAHDGAPDDYLILTVAVRR